jgi:hypothetical protein
MKPSKEAIDFMDTSYYFHSLIKTNNQHFCFVTKTGFSGYIYNY